MKNKRETILMTLTMVALAVTVRCTPAAGTEKAPNPQTPVSDATRHESAFAAPGRIEAATELIELGTAMDGLIAEIVVQEGDRVEIGDTLARLTCLDRKAAFNVATAELDSAQALRRRLIRGSREEQRRAAATATMAARAVLTKAQTQHDRLERLSNEASIVSEEALGEAFRDFRVAEAQLARAEEEERLVNATLLPEELARADAEVAAARQRVLAADARTDQCQITAPVAGTVLRIHLQPGEQVSRAYPRPIISMADMSRMRVRAEVDERDVGKVAPGRKVWITADALGDTRLQGTVVQIELMMGRKKIRTGDPAEKSDRDVQEVVIDLEEGTAPLAIGLRVTAIFMNG